VETEQLTIFRGLTDGERKEEEQERFRVFSQEVKQWIGHSILGYDVPIIRSLLGICIPVDLCIDTLILSKLTDYSRPGGHSLEQFGEELGLPKGKNHYLDFFKSWSQPLEDYCVRDVEISHHLYLRLLPTINDPDWSMSIQLEQRFQQIVNDLHTNGFAFDIDRAHNLLTKVIQDLEKLDEKILKAFPPKEVLIREFTPKLTKFGTISRTSVPRALHHEIHKYESGKSYRHTSLVPFNPSSHKQLIEVLNNAQWKPEDKTQTHIETERLLARVKRSEVDSSSDLTEKLKKLKVTGWKINETNLSTLPEGAPEGARLLAKRILLESRRRTLTEWLSLVSDDDRIHGKFYGIGAWTHRMAHQKPNTANIPTAVEMDGSPKLLGKEMRQLWIAPKNRLLVGVDAEGIQLRIFAHYIDDKEFTDALVNGQKAKQTDPHSLNRRILGSVCKSRQAAKRFVFALLLGGGITKLAAILGCSVPEAKEALDRLLERYTGFAKLRKTQIPKDARKGGFIGLDNRFVPIPGESQRDKEHLAMSGYLQNGEAIIVKRAAIITDESLKEEKSLKKWLFVNIVHDELQSEVKNDMGLALRVAKIKADAIKAAGEFYKLKCPMAGSYFNEETKEYTIGKNWYLTH